MALSLADLNLSKQCDNAAPLELVGQDGKPLGVTLMVLGGHSATVTNAINKAMNTRRRAEALAAKRGKKSEYVPIEEDIEFGIEATAVRISGWSGLSEEYSAANAAELCRINPEIAKQVREFSEDLANFTKG